MKRYILFIFVALFCLLSVSAQPVASQKHKAKRTVMLTTSIKDSFTMVKLRAFVTLMRDDSTVVDTMTCRGWNRDYWARFQVPAQPARYIIKAECGGYATAYSNYEVRHVARNSFFKMPDVLLKKTVRDDIYKEVDLDGVVVTGTKVKFTYRGDTLVYNASAFNVPDGSMLDALVRQLPGAELKSNGDIYVNGKKIDYLTLNGKDFFKGNNKVMLDNLPHYVVQDIKVYNKSTEKSRLMGEDVEKKDYVMDVAMKRDYNRGNILNAEVAGGTRDRYMARLFGLYYDDYTRLSLFGNVNNVNEDRRPGGEGDWSPANMPQGEKTTKQVGASLSTQNKKGSLKEQFDGTVSWNDVTDRTRNSAEQFSSAGNIFSRSSSSSRQKEVRVSASNNLSYNDEASLFMQSSTSLSYADGTNTSSTRRATYDADPKRWGGVEAVLDSTFGIGRGSAAADAINRTRTAGYLKFSTTSLSQSLMFGRKLPWGDILSIVLNGSYTSNKPQQTFSLSDNEYLREDRRDLRRVYADSHSKSYNYSAVADYRVQLGGWRLGLSQRYNQGFTSSNRLNYRLERLGGVYAGSDWQRPDRLPSTRDSLLLAFDAQNSQTYRLLTREYGGEVSLTYNKNNTAAYVNFPYRLVRERISYCHSSLDTVAVRRKWLFGPSLYFNKWSDRFDFYGGYSISCSQPDLASLMPSDNDINPLARRISNNSLKMTVSHNLNATVRLPFNKKKNWLTVGFNGSLTANMIGTRTTYDTSTGGYTYMDDNVGSGNWNLNAYALYTGKLDRKGLFAIDNRLSVDYTKNTDFDIAYDDASSALSRVYTSVLRDNIVLTFQKGDLRLSLTADGQWRHSTGNRQNFQTINAWDYNYGMTLGYKLPLGITVATDLKQYSRRGYSEISMNTDDLVWNASLSRSFCKGRLTLTAEGFDLLHQLSSTTYTVDAQGRTEIWRNTIPNYAMLHVAYKLTRMPKKK